MTLLVVLLVAAAIVSTLAAARAVRRSATRSIELSPGQPGRVPIAWAGAHSSEARAHRRLVAALRSARAAPGTSDATMSAELTRLEEEAAHIEACLLAAAAVPGERRGPAVERAVDLVERFESMVADLVLAAGESPAALDRAVAESILRRAALSEARLEVERIDRRERTPE
ncbi:MAG: hypothetical protein ACO225_12505 [Ilumatobacteraceae bacterium]